MCCIACCIACCMLTKRFILFNFFKISIKNNKNFLRIIFKSFLKLYYKLKFLYYKNDTNCY